MASKAKTATTTDRRKGWGWRVRAERRVYNAEPWFSVYVQKIDLPDGKRIDDYHQIHFPDYVTVIGRTGGGRFILVHKYNHGFGRACMMLPGGMRSPKERPGTAAARELLEETGYTSRYWRQLGRFIPHSNYGCGKVYIYFADDCRPAQPPHSGDLEEMEVRLVGSQELDKYLRSGTNPSLSCRCAYLLAREYLGNRKRK